MKETSIIIRALNEGKHLRNLLKAIEKQDYKDYEVILVDNDSDDDTLEIAKEFKVRTLKVAREDFTWGYALNVGCKESQGRYLVFISAHTLPVDNKWLGNLIAPFSDERVAMVYGRQVGVEQSKFSEQMDFKRLFSKTTKNPNVIVDYANNANSAVRKELWEKRQFDEYLFGLEDIDWARYATSAGYKVPYEPNSAIYHIHNESWPQLFNRYRREAIAAVRLDLERPPQASTHLPWVLYNLLLDLFSSFPDYSPRRVEEVFKFRYYQWKASRVGWAQGSDIDFDAEKESSFYSEDNIAVVIKGVRKASLEEMSLPKIRPGDVLIKVEYVGVCSTDLEVYDGTLGYYREGLAKYPIVPGHEFSGTILKIGSNNRLQERLRVGMRVVGETILSRGNGHERKEVGVVNHNGAYSKYIIMPGNAIKYIPDDVDSKTAVLAEPLSVVVRALRRLEYRLSKDAEVAVIGAGQIGNLCAQMLALKGYSPSVFDRNVKRLQILSGEASSIHTDLEDLGKFDVIIEATGSKEVLDKVLNESITDSTLLLLGFPYGNIEYNFEDIVGKDKVIIGSVGADGEDVLEALRTLPKLNMGPFTKVVMPLKDFSSAWQKHKDGKFLKILLKP